MSECVCVRERERQADTGAHTCSVCSGGLTCPRATALAWCLLFGSHEKTPLVTLTPRFLLHSEGGAQEVPQTCGSFCSWKRDPEKPCQRASLVPRQGSLWHVAVPRPKSAHRRLKAPTVGVSKKVCSRDWDPGGAALGQAVRRLH